jgi:hypothetical protein
VSSYLEVQNPVKDLYSPACKVLSLLTPDIVNVDPLAINYRFQDLSRKRRCPVLCWYTIWLDKDCFDKPFDLRH